MVCRADQKGRGQPGRRKAPLLYSVVNTTRCKCVQGKRATSDSCDYVLVVSQHVCRSPSLGPHAGKSQHYYVPVIACHCNVIRGSTDPCDIATSARHETGFATAVALDESCHPAIPCVSKYPRRGRRKLPQIVPFRSNQIGSGNSS